MSYAEKKTMLATHSSENMMWKVLVVLTGLNLAYGLFTVVKFFITASDSLSSAGIFSGFVTVGIFIGLALNAWISWGIYRLERWVTMWMWIGLVFSVLSFNIIGIVIYVAVLVIYKKILAIVYPKTPAAPTPTA